VTNRVNTVGRGVESMQGNIQMMTLLPLLASPKPLEVTTATTIGGTAVPAGTKLQVAGDGIMSLLPLLLLSGGLGGSTGSAPAQGGGMGDPMMMVVLAMALSDRK
jgi:hypothetical protein